MNAKRGRILIIDDDALVLRGMRRLLARQYDVATAPGGAEALDVLREDRSFDVIICDLMMPGVDGIDLHAALSERSAPLAERLIFCSGGACTPRAEAFVAASSNPMLDKPIRAEDLFAAIDQVIACAPRGDVARSARA